MAFVGPFPLAAAIERAKAIASFRAVGQAADLATALKQEPAAMPALYLVREERAKEPSFGTGAMVQHVEAALAAVLMLRNYAQSDTGAAARDEMDALIGALRLQFLGWRPTTDFMPLRLASDSENVYAAGRLVSQIVFVCSYRIKVPT